MTDNLKNKCTICGEPMPENETMFKYHGLSGPCPKPPLNTPAPVTDEARREIDSLLVETLSLVAKENPFRYMTVSYVQFEDKRKEGVELLKAALSAPSREKGLMECIGDLAEAVGLILPLAKGYAPDGQTETARKTCDMWLRIVDAVGEKHAALIAEAKGE